MLNNQVSAETQEHKHIQVRSRNEPFVAHTATRIWKEDSSDDNPFIAISALCHGYDLYELMEKRSFVDVFYLLFRGELPSKSDAQLLQQLMIALINPGPRHPATRAAMNVGVGKTDPLHILPISTAVLGGAYMGGGEIEPIMRFFRKHQKINPAEFVAGHLARLSTEEAGTNGQQDKMSEQFLGFGVRNGGIEIMAIEIAQRLAASEGAGEALQWACAVGAELKPYGIGVLTTGVAAAVFTDLGFQPRAGGSLFQLLGAPGLLAHGLELANKPITAMPFVKDENYDIKR